MVYDKKMIAVLHNIRSCHNVGSIFRTADAFGCEKIYLSGLTSTPRDIYGRENKRVAKVALGAENFLAWEHIKSTARLIDKLKKNGFIILALEQNPHSVSLADFSLEPKHKYALVLGSETEGLSPAILKRADKILEIPMLGKKESLNVSVAFGIALWQCRGRSKI
ncbi:MAG: TrmH family RNA methyltransferase [Candidatus Komeilibacteria bacterium]|nr:TrmH family RNA methyltransferase [Candidatus Komeilibacteria bacterium]